MHRTGRIDPQELSTGKAYSVAKKVALMPVFKTTLPRIEEHLARIRWLEPRTPFRVMGRKKARHNYRYRVEVDGKLGWINSVALYGGPGMLREEVMPVE